MKDFLFFIGLGIFIVLCVGAIRMEKGLPFFPTHDESQTTKAKE